MKTLTGFLFYALFAIPIAPCGFVFVCLVVVGAVLLKGDHG